MPSGGGTGAETLLGDDFPCVDEPVERPRRVGRRSGREADGAAPRYFLGKALVVVLARFAVGVNAANVGAGQNGTQIVRDGIFDAAVRAAGDLAGGEHIPQRNMMLKQKPHFLVYALRYVGLIDRSENAPEAILQMAVIKHVFPRFHRREAAEDKYLGFRVVYRRERMNKHINKLPAKSSRNIAAAF